MNSKRRAYRVSSRRGRAGVLFDANEEGEDDWGSEDDEEGLDRRLARLIREAQEVQAELERRKTEEGDIEDGKDDTDEQVDEEANVTAKFRELNMSLEKMRNSQTDAGSAHARLAKQLSRTLPERKDLQSDTTLAGSRQSAAGPERTDSNALSKVAEFDSRLASLERALGVSPLDTPEATLNGKENFTPVLPTLSLLDRQVKLLSSVPSQPHLDAVVQRLQQSYALEQTPPESGDYSATPSNLTPEEMAKLRSLYAILPTLTSLAPTLSPLLARLRSLRTLHTNAAAASQTLDEVERRQDEADKEIKEWTEGLARSPKQSRMPREACDRMSRL